MAHAELTDFYQNFRFHVMDPNGFLSPVAGFQTVGVPEYTVDPADYREGWYTYTRKYPGIPTVSELTFQKGVARVKSDFYRWVLTAIEGGQYRTDLLLFQYHRSDILATIGSTQIGAPSRTYRIFEAFPTRAKPGADMDSGSGDVSLQELAIQYESFELEEPASPASSA